MKYITFLRLLIPLYDLSLPAQAGESKRDKNQRQVSDLLSWLEAWNVFVAIKVQAARNGLGHGQVQNHHFASCSPPMALLRT